MPMLQGLNEPQSRILLLMSSLIARHVPGDLQSLRDEDIAEAAGAVAATLETSRRGVIYEHRAGTLVAQHLSEALKGLLDELGHTPRALDTSGNAPGPDGAPAALDAGQRVDRGRLERDAALVLRRIEQSARDTASQAGTAGADADTSASPSRYRDLLARTFKAAPAPPRSEGSPGSRLIIP